MVHMEGQRVEDSLHSHKPASLDIFKNQLNNKKVNIHTNLLKYLFSYVLSMLDKILTGQKGGSKFCFVLLDFLWRERTDPATWRYNC